ncbi:hypothetical protein [Psychrobacillus sp. FSL K6-1464]|uniref:hypothetical protein n=1 Tax=Psychrobacillus sp. FSL K6-1464 TaxID=2921545 RepID=UPI0030F7A937
MTSLDLQKSLKRKITEALVGMELTSQEGVLKKVQVFEQHLPRKVKSDSRKSEETNYPAVIVYLDEGENGQVKVLLIIATQDSNADNEGFRDTLSIAERLMQLLVKNPVIDDKYEIQDSPKWFYNDQDNYPYYFAWIETTFDIPQILREDLEAMI